MPLLVIAGFVLAAVPGLAQVSAVPGATADSVLAIARQLSPELRAGARSRSRSGARRCGRPARRSDLPGMSDEIDRTSGPRKNKMYLTVEQEFPLWGKRDLQARRPGARSMWRAAVRVRATAELDEKIKVAFAQYYRRPGDPHDRELHGSA